MLTRELQSREPGSGQAVIRAQRGAGGHSERDEAGGWWAPSVLWGSPLAKDGFSLSSQSFEAVLKVRTWGGIWLSRKEVFLLRGRDRGVTI